MRSSLLRLLVVTSSYFLILLGLAACVEKSSVKLEPTSGNAQLQTDSKRGKMDTRPILRVETGMHTALIRGIAVDTAEHYLVTGSDDKTVRVWSLADGQLLRVLRPPIGEWIEGQIKTVAISPDSKTIAAGGSTGWWDGVTRSIYLFNRVTGKLQHSITGLPNTVLDLAYSQDGRYLVASLSSNGIRVYRTTDNQLQYEDPDYGNQSYSAEFDGQGRIVTTCLDGYIRLYDRDFRLSVKRPAPGGKQPFTARFSHNGDKIVVGFADSSQVNVLAGDDLRFLYSPDTPIINFKGGLEHVNWSEDDNLLYAGGSMVQVATGNIHPILRWSDAGRGKTQSILVSSNNTVMGIRTLQGGAVAFISSDPSFGVFYADGRKRLDIRADNADFRGIYSGNRFLVSSKGDTVQFGFDREGKRPAQFSLKEFSLKELTPGFGVRSSDLQAPLNPCCECKNQCD